jgi:hypothetical protein
MARSLAMGAFLLLSAVAVAITIGIAVIVVK